MTQSTAMQRLVSRNQSMAIARLKDSLARTNQQWEQRLAMRDADRKAKRNSPSWLKTEIELLGKQAAEIQRQLNACGGHQ